MEKKTKHELDVAAELILRPTVKSHPEESPEDPDEARRISFYAHKSHFFVFTSAGKPVYTRYGDVYNVSSLCASYSAILPKLQSLYSEQDEHVSKNLIRYVRSPGMLAVFMFRKNLVYVCVSKSRTDYTIVQRQLECLHIQVPPLFVYRVANRTDHRVGKRPAHRGAQPRPQGPPRWSLPFVQISRRNRRPGPNDFHKVLCAVAMRGGERVPGAADEGGPQAGCERDADPESACEDAVLLDGAMGGSFGMVIANCAFVTALCANGIPLKSYDMNALLIYLMANPTKGGAESTFSLCLPGIADDGYIQFFVRFITPNITVLFAGARKADCDDFASKAASVSKLIAELGFVWQLTRSLHENFISRTAFRLGDSMLHAKTIVY